MVNQTQKMTRKNLSLLMALALAILASTASAANNFQRCFQCFFTNRETAAFCDSSGECLSNLSLNCDEAPIESYFDCPQRYVTATCSNHTFTNQDFNRSGELAVRKSMTLQAGEACMISIDRTTDGSYGTVTIQYDNPYLMVFDDTKIDFATDDRVGLIEEPTQSGWAPRTFLVANAAPFPTQFNAIYDGALNLLTSATLSAVLLISSAFILC